MRTDQFRFLSSFIALIVFFSACKKDTETVNNPICNIRGNASGKQEVPANASPATGTLSGTYDKDKNLLTYTVTWTGLTGGNPTAAHFHGAADPGVAVGVKVTLTNFPATTSGTYSGTTTPTETDEADLVNGQWYYNIHNDTYKGGEIRG